MVDASTDTSGTPKVTVITVVWNAEQWIDATLQSVLSQQADSVEVLVVDGASSDRTVERVMSYGDDIDRLVSEPDRGLYDAMNKGVAMARGEYILFMNAGDQFHSNDSLSALVNAADEHADLVYGDHMVVYEDGSCRHSPAGQPEHLWKGMICSHQALMARRALLLKHPFKISRLGADFEFILTCFVEGARFVRVPAVIADMSAGGLSDVRRLKSLLSRWATVRELVPSLRHDCYYLGLMVDACLRRGAKAVLPGGWVNHLRMRGK